MDPPALGLPLGAQTSQKASNLTSARFTAKLRRTLCEDVGFLRLRAFDVMVRLLKTHRQGKAVLLNLMQARPVREALKPICQKETQRKRALAPLREALPPDDQLQSIPLLRSQALSLHRRS